MMHVGFLPHFCLSAQRSPCCCQRAAPAERIAPQVVCWQCPERSWVLAAPPCTLTDWWRVFAGRPVDDYRILGGIAAGFTLR